MSKGVYARLNDNVFITCRPVYGVVITTQSSLRRAPEYPTWGETGSVHYVDQRTCEILTLFSGEKSVEECIATLSRRSTLPFPACEEVVNGVIKDALERDIIAVNDAAKSSDAKIEGSFEIPTPRWLSLEITNACNLGCIHCYGAFGELTNVKMMSLDDMEKISSEAYEVGIRMVDVTGGEPLLHPNFFQVMDCLNEKFPIIALITNGTLVDKSVVSKLKKYENLRSVSISLHSTTSTYHDGFTGEKGSWEKALNAIKMLIQAGIPTRIAMIVTPHNLPHIEEMFSLKRKLKAFEILPQAIYPVGRAEHLQESGIMLFPHHENSAEEKKRRQEFLETLSRVVDKYVENGEIRAAPKKELLDLQKIKRNCGLGHAMWTVDVDGCVRPCAMMPNDMYMLGNILEESAEKIQSNEKCKKLSYLDAPHPTICQSCQYVGFCAGCVLRGLLLAKSFEGCEWYKSMGKDFSLTIQEHRSRGCSSCSH
ncbi:MAG: Antilisterial bacteriocin subtilosin biosynthesis protein AlbA [Syntrophomonadaceae bacterium]|nr:Antilisterial bacteriocin subtilosin biosynthesis protein AlbA [Bacillota bacterium]MBT9147809.1 Antilisterial bacteriocin subtilosin biosynthesis protein AlbA [Bacillota bacterium]